MNAPTSDIRKLMESVFGDARKIALSGEEVCAAFFGQSQDGQVYVYMTPWRDEDDKRMALQMLKLAFVVHGVQSYVQVSECWTVTRYDKDEAENGPAPSECPDRQEILMVLGVEHGKVLTATAKLGYDKDANRTVGDLNWLPQDTELTGRMTGLLPPKGLPLMDSARRELAESLLIKMGMQYAQRTDVVH